MLQFCQHLRKRPRRFMSNLLQVIDILELLQAVEDRLLDEVVHDDSARPAELIEGLLEPGIDTGGDLDGAHGSFLTSNASRCYHLLEFSQTGAHLQLNNASVPRF